jgi:hypothetical protein
MTYEAAYMCSVALLRGLTLQAERLSTRTPGVARVSPRLGDDAYDQAQAFIEIVGPERALRAAHRALHPPKKRRVKWM